jgi:hypothetical protein
MNNVICKDIENLFVSSIYPDCPKKPFCDNLKEFGFSKKPKMPFIGRQYATNPKIPNLLFISLDSGDEYANYHTIDEIRKGVEDNPPRLNPGKGEVVRHWYQTFDLAALILGYYFPESLKIGGSYVDAFVAHTNSAKCTQSKKGREQADNRLFENCREFILKEIPFFDAQIIITQGIPAKNCLSPFLISETIVLEAIHNDKEIQLPIYIRKINGKNVLHIPMNHPSFFKGYWGQKQVLKINMDKIIDIIEKVKNC